MAGHHRWPRPAPAGGAAAAGERGVLQVAHHAGRGRDSAAGAAGHDAHGAARRRWQLQRAAGCPAADGTGRRRTRHARHAVRSRGRAPRLSPSGVASPPRAGGAQFDPTQRLRAMAMQLKRANPGLDNQTLAVALDQQINAMKGLAPEDRIVMQMELAQQKFQMTRDIAALRDDLGRLQETGRNTRAGNAEAGRNDRAALARQEAQAGQRSDARATTLPRAGVESDPTLSPVVGG